MTPTTTSPAPRPGWDPRHYEALIDVLVARIARAEDKPERVVRHSLPLPPAPPIYPLPTKSAARRTPAHHPAREDQPNATVRMG